MKFQTLIEKRQSCRDFDGKKVPKDVLLSILEDAHNAPSARNLQPWHFWIVEDESLFKKLTDPMRDFVKKAGGFVIITTSNEKIIESSTTHDYRRFDSGIVTAHVVLAAESRGVKSCIIGSFHDDNVKALIPKLKDLRIQMMVAFGYSCNEVRKKDREPIKSKITYL